MTPIDIVEKLAVGYSTQTKRANQFWLVLIIASTITLTGHIDRENFVQLPFTLGSVIPSDFYSICLVMISALLVAFTSAMIQALRSRMLIEKCINKMVESEKFMGEIHIKDYLDSIVTPTFSRVAPIPQFILGKNQFLGEGPQNKLSKTLGICLYFLLKIATFTFTYFIPFIAINVCWKYLVKNPKSGVVVMPDWLIIGILLIASICTIIIFIGEIKYLIRVLKRLNK
jgi:hypothetical protein